MAEVADGGVVRAAESESASDRRPLLGGNATGASNGPNSANVAPGAANQRPAEQGEVNIRINGSRRSLPDFLQSINLKHVKLGYHYLITHALTLCLIPLFLSVGVDLLRMNPADVLQLWDHLQFNLISVLTCVGITVFAVTMYLMSRPRPVYLVDYSCYKPGDHLKSPAGMFLYNSSMCGAFDETSMDFQRKILERSGLGEETYLPEGVRGLPPDPCMANARLEAEEVMFGALDDLLQRTKIKPKDIDILVVNCSLFNPTPSLSAMVVNKYGLRGNIRTYNLGGMGCSAGVIAVDLAKDLLQVHGSSYAVVISTENITQNWYFGNRRSMLIPNCLFRMGSAAVLLSNRRRDRRRAKYELVHTVRTHKGADDKCFRVVYQEQDEAGKLGVGLSKDLMAIAGDALKTNITTLGPMVLPLSEQLLFFVVLVARKVFRMRVKPYIPDFKLAFEHFCIHAGGRAVLDEVERNLSLHAWHLEPSRMALYRFGNTSSSSIWYELAYTEAKGRVRRGDRVWQIAFGSGFKCNSAVWRALRTIRPDATSVWADDIDKLPVDLPAY